jgi:hypothetical protein
MPKITRIDKLNQKIRILELEKTTLCDSVAYWREMHYKTQEQRRNERDEQAGWLRQREEQIRNDHAVQMAKLRDTQLQQVKHLEQKVRQLQAIATNAVNVVARGDASPF